VDKSGRLKASGLLGQFAGEQIVWLALTYPQQLAEYPAESVYDPEYFPVDAFIKDCRRLLAAGSSVLLVPYPTADPGSKGAGHVMSVGLGGSYKLSFRWNDQPIPVGPDEPASPEHITAAKTYAAQDEASYEA